MLWLFYTSWVVFSLLLGGSSLLWAYRSGYHEPGLTGILVALVVTFSIYPAMLLSRQFLLRRLRPILDVLLPTTGRITSSESRQTSARLGHGVTISPARRRVLRISYVILVARYLGSLIARTIDMYAMDHSMLSALSNANANFSGTAQCCDNWAFHLGTVARGEPDMRCRGMVRHLSGRITSD